MIFYYDVVSSSNLRAVVDEVQRMVKLGWEPQGGISFSPQNNLWAQAIVYRYKEEEEEE